MLTDTARGPIDARSFLLRSVAWSLGLLVLVRLSWIEAHLLVPFVRAQDRMAVAWFGAPTLPVETTLACTHAD